MRDPISRIFAVVRVYKGHLCVQYRDISFHNAERCLSLAEINKIIVLSQCNVFITVITERETERERDRQTERVSERCADLESFQLQGGTFLFALEMKRKNIKTHKN